MKVFSTPFEGLLILEPDVFVDERGHFSEAYSYQRLKDHGIDIRFLQDNQSYSKKGVIRGLHYQSAPKAQTKLVRVLHGVIIDIVVDLRKEQATFGMVHSVEMSKENGKQILVPKGFAHGFSVVSESAEVLYKCDELYTPSCEGGIHFDDPDLKIDWRVSGKDRIVSPKDKALPRLKDAKYFF